jgi:WD40 repeat protein
MFYNLSVPDSFGKILVKPFEFQFSIHVSGCTHKMKWKRLNEAWTKLTHCSTSTAKLSKGILALPKMMFWRAFQSIFRNFNNSQQSLEAEQDSRKSEFADIPMNVIVSNIFPFFENRTDWNNFSMVTKDIRNAVKNHKKLVPPWPENYRLSHESYCFKPTFSPNGEFICYLSWGRIHILCRRKGLVQSWKAHDPESISSITYSPDAGNLLVSSGGEVKFWDAANDYSCIQTLQWDNKGGLAIAFSPNGEIIAIGG